MDGERILRVRSCRDDICDKQETRQSGRAKHRDGL